MKSMIVSLITLWYMISFCIGTLQAEVSYRIAFVKQVVYQDLYCAPSNASACEIVCSSLKRSGPVALFTRLNADFYIVNEESDKECQAWKEKALVCKQKPLSHYHSLKTVPQIGHTKAQGDYAVNCDDINWGSYDIVISVDISIPSRITKKYPSTLWVYYIGESAQPAYRRSMAEIIEGYDYFLSQNFAQHPSLRPHVIEFPYMLQYFPCYEELFNEKIDDSERRGIALECHTAQYFEKSGNEKELSLVMPIVVQTRGSNAILPIKSMLQHLMYAKFFIIYVPDNVGIRDRIQGNALAEAVASGCLVLARKKCLKNSDIINKKTAINSIDDLINKINYFENNPEEFKKELENQRQKINYLCFERPVTELYAKCELKKGSNGCIN